MAADTYRTTEIELRKKMGWRGATGKGKTAAALLNLTEGIYSVRAYGRVWKPSWWREMWGCNTGTTHFSWAAR